VNGKERPRTPVVDLVTAGWDEALSVLSERIKRLVQEHGTGSIAIVGSQRLSQEGNLMAAQLRQFTGGPLCYFIDDRPAEQAARAFRSANDKNNASLNDIRHADLVAIVADDLLNQAPMAALAVRQAWRKGAKVYLIGNENRNGSAGLLFEAEKVASLNNALSGDAARPVIIYGSAKDIEPAKAENFQHAKRSYLLDGPNSFGCAVLAAEQDSLSLSQALAGGQIKALISLEADIPEKALQGVRLLAVADWKQSVLIDRAEVFLPTTAWVEMDGTFINNEGRTQSFKQVMEPGLPIRGLDPALHPPREIKKDVPGGNLLPAWRVAELLIEKLDL
jgi:NADH-quinone oxidoreductase subunit G